MRVRTVVSLLLVCVFAYGASVLAQNRPPLVGAWERFSLKNDEGVDIQPPEPAAFVIFTVDGYFSQTVIPTGRNKLKKPLEDMTKEELLHRGPIGKKGAPYAASCRGVTNVWDIPHAWTA